MNRARFFLAVSGGLLFPSLVWAGMPSPFGLLTETARWRFQNLSFFLLGFCLSCWAVQYLWNNLQRDFSFLPRLTYFKAMGLVSLWGLLFVLVLTMISGARELMTPGAWKPNGVTYTLAESAPDLDSVRKEQMTLLKSALWSYAKSREGRFPSNQSDPEIDAERWLLCDASGRQYVYRPGIPSVVDGVPLAWEPEIFGDHLFVLFTDGRIERLTFSDLSRLLSSEAK